MANTILITANWHTGALSQQTISRQYDNNRYVVQFVGYPEASEGNELDYYLLVWMSSAPGERPDEIAPIQLASDQWYISNVFTQQTQQIKFQMCALNTEGTFEAHSPIFTGFVRNSLEHDGTTQDIDVSTLFDAYREYLNELIIRSGAVVIDAVPTQGSNNAVSSGGVYSTIDEISEIYSSETETLTVPIDTSDIKIGKYPNNDTVGCTINAWKDTQYTTCIPNAFVCESGKTYTITVQNENQHISNRYILVTDDNYKIVDKQIYSVTSATSDIISFTPSESGNVLLALDKNYQSVSCSMSITANTKTAIDLQAREGVTTLNRTVNTMSGTVGTLSTTVGTLSSTVTSIDAQVETLTEKNTVELEFEYTDITIDLTELDYINAFVGNSSGKWESQGSGTSLILPIDGYCGFKATAGESNMLYALLTSGSHTVGQNVDFCNGYDGQIQINAGVSDAVSFPSDCTHIWVYRTQISGTNRLPASFKLTERTVTESKPVNEAVLDLIDKDNYLKGITFSVMGDSISAYNGYIDYSEYYPSGNVSSYKKMFWGHLEQDYGMVIDTINADAGSCVGNQWIYQSTKVPATSEERLTGLGTPQVIIIQSGTNDYGGNPLGEYDLSGNYTDLNQFRVSYAYLLYRLKQLYPSAKIVCCTLMARSDRSVENTYPIKQYRVYQDRGTVDKTTHYMFEFNESIRELAKRYDCAVCELSDVINYYNLSNETVDGHCHPNAITHARMAKRIADTIKRVFYKST